MNFVFQKSKMTFFTFALVTLLKQNLMEFYQYFNWTLTASMIDSEALTSQELSQLAWDK